MFRVNIFFFKKKEDHAFTKSRFHAQDTKKKGCPGMITVRDIVFPQL